MIEAMRRSALRAVLIGGSLAALAACASTEDRDQREDLHNTMRRDVVACGTDTECLEKREKSRSKPVESAKAATTS